MLIDESDPNDEEREKSANTFGEWKKWEEVRKKTTVKSEEVSGLEKPRVKLWISRLIEAFLSENPE